MASRLISSDDDLSKRMFFHTMDIMEVTDGAVLMLRSAHGARAFLYPVVNPEDLQGFEVLSIFHPQDEVINSVVIARKDPVAVDTDHNHHHQLGIGSILPSCCKYGDFQASNNPLNQMNIIEELAMEE
ncbi:putative nicotianamine synthase [Helianthus annuus]|uniref:Nicotianamine synthase n=1 Tax=Helianthus annuus TaxID=4232 RepID=A0A9K3I4V8_HELAN|nr:putative nicotianamine synthase [Helianthus annuus]